MTGSTMNVEVAPGVGSEGAADRPAKGDQPQQEPRASADTNQAPSARRIPNAFRGAFLARIDEHDNDAASASEAETDGPWTVVPFTADGIDGYGVWRSWEAPVSDAPRAWFVRRDLALIAAALLPSLGKDRWFDLASESTVQGHRLDDQQGKMVGYLTIFEEDLSTGLHMIECLLRSPASLANVLRAATPVALNFSGQILARDLNRDEARR